MSINDPLGRIEALEQEHKQLKEEVRKLREQATEPIHLTDNALLQTLLIMAGTNATDNAVLKQTTERIEKRLDQMATKDDLKGMEKRFDAMAEVYKLILARLPEKDK